MTRLVRSTTFVVGVMCAVLVLAMCNVGVYVFSLSSTVLTYFEFFVHWLPAALLLGTLAGLLAKLRCQEHCQGRAATFAVVGMLAFFSSSLLVDWRSVFGRAISDYLGRYVSYVGGLMVGTAVELIAAAIIIGTGYWIEKRR